MSIDPFDPKQTDTLINLPAMVQKISLPGMNDNDGSMMCYTDNDGVNKCFPFKGSNEVICGEKDCFVSFKTFNQKMLGNGKRLKKLDLDVLMIPDGLSTSVILVGNIPRNKLRTLKNIVGKIPVSESESPPSLSVGLPLPPGKCHLNPLTKDCSYYLSSDDWMYIPTIGFKRKVDILKNPRTIFKSEIMPRLKNVKAKLDKFLKRGKNGEKSVVRDGNDPMLKNP